MNRITDPTFVPYQPITGKISDEQVQQRSNWQRTPDWSNTKLGGIHVINKRRIGKTTVTEVNPLDPADEGWLHTPSNIGTVHKARIMR